MSQLSTPTRFESTINDGIDLDIFSKRAALGVSSSVVSLETYLGGYINNMGSGTIIACDNVDGRFACYIVTAASVLRRNSREAVIDDLKVDVHLPNGNLCNGHVWAVDLHYNLAVIKIMSDVLLPVARLRRLNDWLSIDLSEPCVERSPLHPHSDSFNLVPGDQVLAVARCCVKPYELVVFPGVFSVDYCYLDCMEAFRANCKIQIIGNGAPLVNCNGEVIGIAFYGVGELYAPFLPVNLVLKWLEYHKTSGQYRHPWLGIKVCNLHTTKLDLLEKVLEKPPKIFGGVFVEVVAPGSPASSAGICPHDIIVQCDGRNIQGLLQFFEIIWDNTGKSIDMVLVKARDGTRLKLSVFIEETKPEKFNRWRFIDQW